MSDKTVEAHEAPEFEAQGDVKTPIGISPAASSTQLDDTYALFKAQDALNIDPAEAKRVLRKIDFRIMPILFITYLLQYLDKSVNEIKTSSTAN